MTAALLVLAGVLGLAIGSFGNVVIWRVPRGESVVRPPSACPSCGHAIRPRDNVPLVSWLLLRGRCRDCGDGISARYPLVELATGALFVLVAAWLLPQDGGLWLVPALWYFVAIAVMLTMIDIDTRRLPDRIVLPSYVVVAVLLVVASVGTGRYDALLRAAVGMAALWLFYFALVMIYPRGMGFGDVKLAGVLGLYLGWFGWGALVVGAFAAFLLGGIFAVGLLVARRAGRKSAVPFGPWMLLGAAVGVVVGEQIWDGYLRLALGT